MANVNGWKAPLDMAFNLAAAITKVVQGTASQFTVDLADGRKLVFGGTFTYAGPGLPTTGSVTSFIEYDRTGSQIAKADGFSVPVATLIAGTDAGRRMEMFSRILGGDDIVIGSELDDTLMGFAGTDFLEGGAGNDKLLGGDGADYLYGGPGDDVLDGGANPSGDTDRANYQSAAGGITVDMRIGKVTADGDGGTDTLIGIERVIGSRYNDTYIGSDGRDNFSGEAGDDYIDGGAGDHDVTQFIRAPGAVIVDLAAGTATGDGNDILIGIEQVHGSAFGDTLRGTDGDNVFTPDPATGGGADLIDGRGGFDTVNYSGEVAGIRVNLAVGTVVDGRGNTDTLISIEYIQGTAFDDHIVGDAGRNWLQGRGGNDTLVGGAGLDTATYTSQRSAYEIRQVGNTLAVTHRNGGNDGTDTLVEVERLRFSDGTLDFDIGGGAGQAYRLYQAAFDRTPDVEGLSFQIRAIGNGASLRDVASGFLASPEFQAKYGTSETVDNGAFVTLLYRNVLDRTPDAAELAYYRDALATGLARADLLAFFSESPENQGNVLPAIRDGIWWV